jgi:hypothetical protein
MTETSAPLLLGPQKLSAVYLDREEVEDGKKMLAIAEQLAPTDPYVQCWM